MQLHNWEVDHDHGNLGNPDVEPYGNGVLLWFEVDAAHRELWIRDPDGYTVVIASPDGEAA